jgi:hydrogenase maturation protein HypF
MRSRLRLAIRGAVQGVGFRPFVYRLATSRGLDGWVRNSLRGVFIEVEGGADPLRSFLEELRRDPPPRAVIQSLEASWLDPAGHRGFEIRASDAEGAADAVVLPDIATCADCRREVFDPSNRRYRYPFTNCTNCGPRFSIIERMPYDRANTSMRAFAMCPSCAREYADPADRRFHAQPNACPACGPRIALWDRDGRAIAGEDGALARAVEALSDGAVVALKGLGGFHLVVDASNAAAVGRLRERKHRVEKPFALMVPSLEAAARECDIGRVEAQLLASPECPIVLLARRDGAERVMAEAVAPGSPTLGIMLPYTPLHHLLLADVGRPIVATSGNLAEEPICTDEREAVERLGGIADLFLVHDRPIVRHVDDSIACELLGRELVMRRARGYAPLPLALGAAARPALAVGAHLKNTVAVTAGRDVVVSQHIGDLETRQSTEAFQRVASDLLTLFHVAPEAVVADDHPDYLSTRYATGFGRPVARVQHHLAHVAACLAENDLEAPVLGVSWDGTGYGTDGTVWGGEFLLVGTDGWERAACLRPFRLPGGERAIREPRRSALGLAHALDPEDAAVVGQAARRMFTPAEIDVLSRALERGVNAPVTTSAGRLFDAAAALAGLVPRASFEGQAAMALEWAFDPGVDGAYSFVVADGGSRWARAMGGWQPPRWTVDWAPAILALVVDAARGETAGVISARFHRMLAAAIVAVAERVGEPRVVLTGGCFQNRRLSELAVAGLVRAGFRPYWHQRVPPNDGGIAVGQLAAWARGLAGPPRSVELCERRPTVEPDAVTT